MNKINCIIIDDESSGRIVLKELLAEHLQEVEIIGEASNISDGFDLIKNSSPDLVFLDIHMPGGTGFELLEKFDTIPFSIVFVTSYDKYAINAIKFSALDYLLKPVDIIELKTSVAKAIEKKKLALNTALLISNLLTNNTSQEKKIAVHVLDKVQFVTAADIICVEASGSYCTMFCANSIKYTTPKLLKDFEEFFENNNDFARINRTQIINLSHLVSYTKGENCIITLSNKMQYEISRRKKTDIKALLEKRNA
jgi:two-component system LytT family response regulator